MAVLEMFGAKMVISRVTTPGARTGYCLKRYPRRINTPNQIKAQIALGEAAYSAYGSKGTIAGIPAVAAKVRDMVPKGAGVHGGKSAGQVREENHAAARGSIEALKSKLAGYSRA